MKRWLFALLFLALTAPATAQPVNQVVRVTGTVPVTQSGNTWNVVCVSGCAAGATSVTTTQGTIPWLVSQSGTPWYVSLTNPQVAIQGTVAVTHSGQPWLVTITNPQVAIQGTVGVTQSGNPWLVTQSATPWYVSLTNAQVAIQGTVGVTQSGNPWLVTQSATPWYVSLTNAQVAIQGMNSVTDPCMSPFIAKTTAFATSNSPTQTVAIASATGKSIFLCSWAASWTGTAAAGWTLEETTTTCTTASPTPMSSLYVSPIQATFGRGAGDATITTVGSGQALCIWVGSTSVTDRMEFTYIQQ